MDLEKMRCERCKFYRSIYIHPWSTGVDHQLLYSHNGFACIAPIDEAFINSMGDENGDPYVSVTIGSKESIGCELFTEKEK